MVDETRVDQGTRETRALWRWVARNAWLVLIALGLGTALGLLAAIRSPVTWEAERVVVPASTDIPSDTFGRLAVTVFETDTVLRPVIEDVGLDMTTKDLLESDLLNAEPVSNAAAIRIVGRASAPALSAALASSAAASFVATAEARGMGTFEVFGGASELATPTSPSIPLWGALGAVGGASLGFLALLLVSLVRRPVLSEAEARRQIAVDAVFAVRVFRQSERKRGGSWIISPTGVEAAIWRTLTARERGGAGRRGAESVCCILVEGTRRQKAWLRPVADRLVESRRSVDGVPGRVSLLRWTRLGMRGGAGLALQDAGSLLLLVPEGTPAGILGDLGEVIQALPSARKVLVLVRRARAMWSGRRSGEARGAEPFQIKPWVPDREAAAGSEWEGRGAPRTSVPPPEVVGGTEGEALETPEHLRSLTHPSVEVRLEALDALERQPAIASFDAVVSRLRDPEPSVRRATVRVLGSMNEDRAWVALIEALSDPSEDVRAVALATMAKSRSRVAADQLVRRLSSPEQREAAAQVLREMGGVAVDALRDAAADSDGGRRHDVLDVLRSMGSSGQEQPAGLGPTAGEEAVGTASVVDALVRRLSDPDPEVRIKAAEALGELGSEQAVEPLRRAMTADPHMSVAIAIAHALRKLGSPAELHGGE